MMVKSFYLLIVFAALMGLAACAASDNLEPVVLASSDGGQGVAADKVSVDNCPEAVPGTHLLIYAAEGYCFLYPDEYDVFQSDDGSLTLYVRSLLNTEAPLATVRSAAQEGRTIQEVVPDYPSDAELAAMSLLTIDLGGEIATVFDNLPGQDTNRRIFAVHDDIVYDLMIARIGEEYDAVGEEAEALYELITTSWRFIGIEPEAPLLAGPECPEAPLGTTLFTNVEDGFCLLLPDGYAVDDSLTTDSGGAETAVYVDSPLDAAHARLFITVEDAGGRSLDEFTTAKEAELGEAIPGYDVIRSFGYMLDGVPANQFDKVPGQDLSRVLVMVHNDRLFTLNFIPDDPDAGDAYDEMQALYDVVIESFSFLRSS